MQEARVNLNSPALYGPTITASNIPEHHNIYPSQQTNKQELQTEGAEHTSPTENYKELCVDWAQRKCLQGGKSKIMENKCSYIEVEEARFEGQSEEFRFS